MVNNMNTLKQDNKKSGSPEIWYNIAKRVAPIALVFALIISLLLIVNYIQTKSIDPLNSQAISQLMEQLKKNPNDTSLKEQIRALDLLARKAYFTYQWQIRTGGFLLFVFVLIFLISLKCMSSLKSQFPDLKERLSPDTMWGHSFLSRRYILISGLAIFILAFVLGVLSDNDIKNLLILKSKGNNSAQTLAKIEETRKNWPGFRGPDGTGIAYQTRAPLKWDGKTNKNIAWKIPIPLRGFNSPIIWGNKLFLSGADKKNPTIYCIDTASGKILWQTELNDIPGSPDKRPKVTDDTGYAASTMTTDGHRVFAIYATGDIACVDFSGKRIWAKNLGMPDNHYGHASSLVLYQDILLVQLDQNSGGHLIALKSGTGNLLYHKMRDVQISWASPIVVDTGSRAEIILNSNPFVISYDPLSGRELWRMKCMSGEIGPSPAYADGMVYVVNEYARLAAIRLGALPEIAWEFDDDLSEVASPLATKDFVIVAASYGAVSCFNSKSGERHWVHEFDNGFYSSPILIGANVYLMDEMGVMYIFKMDKEFHLIGRNILGEKAVTIPAIMPDRIYIRGDKHLFCIERGKSSEAGSGND